MDRFIRLYFIYFVVACFVILPACGNKTTENNKTDETGQAASQKNGEGEADQGKGTSEKKEKKSPANVEAVLTKAAEVMGNVSGMKYTGVSESETDGVEEIGGTTEINGELSLNPLVIHMNIRTAAESEMEVYADEENMYVKDPSGNWLLMGGLADTLDSGGTALSATHVDYLMEHAGHLRLSERDGHYIISHSGSGDVFKRVTYGYMEEAVGKEFFEDFIGSIEDASGTFELAIDKQTFHVTAIDIDREETTVVEGLGKIHSKEMTRVEYRDFDKTVVTIPNEVKDKAISIPMDDDGDQGDGL